MHANHGIAAVALTPRGEFFAAASIDDIVRVATTDSPDSALAKFEVGAPVVDMAFSNDGVLLAVLLDEASGRALESGGARVQIYQVLCARKLSEFRLDALRPRNLYFSEQNVLHGVCVENGRIGRWDLMTQRAVSSPVSG
jgi:hypothetical protein